MSVGFRSIPGRGVGKQSSKGVFTCSSQSWPQASLHSRRRARPRLPLPVATGETEYDIRAFTFGEWV